MVRKQGGVKDRSRKGEVSRPEAALLFLCSTCYRVEFLVLAVGTNDYGGF